MTRLPEMADFTQDTEGISRRLTQLREARGLSRRRLAFDLDVTDAALGFWERGRSAPSTLAIMKYAVYFGVTTDWILTGSETTGWLERNKDRILQAGLEGREVEFRIGGRLFAIREKAQ